MLDVGVYALTVLTTAFGPVKRVYGFGGVCQPKRRPARADRTQGSEFYVETPDLIAARVGV